jgi:hypothetical protein
MWPGSRFCPTGDYRCGVVGLRRLSSFTLTRLWFAVFGAGRNTKSGSLVHLHLPTLLQLVGCRLVGQGVLDVAIEE